MVVVGGGLFVLGFLVGDGGGNTLNRATVDEHMEGHTSASKSCYR